MKPLHLGAICVGMFYIATSVAKAEIEIGPSSITRNIYGVDVTTKFTTYIDVDTTNLRNLVVKARVRADLSDLQDKFDRIVKTIPVQADNCPSYGTHILPRIESANIEAAGTSAKLKLVGHATVWTCTRNPVPEAVCGTRQECRGVYGPLGHKITDICISVPDCRMRDGSPLKTVLFSEGFSGELPVSIISSDGQSVSVVPGRPAVFPRGDLGRFLNDIAKLFNSDLSTLADKELDKLMDAQTLGAALPDELKKYKVKITSASFGAQDSKLIFLISAEASVTTEMLTGVAAEILKAKTQKQ